MTMLKRLAHYTSVVWLAAVIMTAVFSPFFLQAQAMSVDLGSALEAPSLQHLLGTDALGRDLLARLCCGIGVSLGIALAATALSFLLGVLMGLLSGLARGLTDSALMLVSDLFLCFPVLFIILSFDSVIRSSVWYLAILIGLTGWMSIYRLTRAQVISVKQRPYVIAAKVMRYSPARVALLHVLPASVGPAYVNALLFFPAALLAEAGLSFLGMGILPPMPSLGNIMADARACLGSAWWMMFFPGFFIWMTLASLYYFAQKLENRYA